MLLVDQVQTLWTMGNSFRQVCSYVKVVHGTKSCCSLNLPYPILPKFHIGWCYAHHMTTWKSCLDTHCWMLCYIFSEIFTSCTEAKPAVSSVASWPDTFVFLFKHRTTLHINLWGFFIVIVNYSLIVDSCNSVSLQCKMTGCGRFI